MYFPTQSCPYTFARILWFSEWWRTLTIGSPFRRTERRQPFAQRRTQPAGESAPASLGWRRIGLGNHSHRQCKLLQLIHLLEFRILAKKKKMYFLLDTKRFVNYSIITIYYCLSWLKLHFKNYKIYNCKKKLKYL